MSDLREALQAICKICAESSQYSRRMQSIHNVAMTSLGLTENQRQERHNKAEQRAEQYKEDRQAHGESHAKKLHILSCEADTGEDYEKCRKVFVK